MSYSTFNGKTNMNFHQHTTLSSKSNRDIETDTISRPTYQSFNDHNERISF